VAETLLRRTRAAQVERRIGEVLERYPTPRAMACTPVEQVRKDLRSFGLQWRADNLAASSQVIVHQLEGRVPTDLEGLMALPGVGPYVAASTSATVNESEVTLIDTNTVRVAARVAGVYQPGDIRRRPEVVAAVESLLGGNAPASDWWAVLDLAATVCRPGEAHCALCPIRLDCATGSSGESADA
jgi:A/G-specific adenine glycosylase